MGGNACGSIMAQFLKTWMQSHSGSVWVLANVFDAPHSLPYALVTCLGMLRSVRHSWMSRPYWRSVGMSAYAVRRYSVIKTELYAACRHPQERGLASALPDSAACRFPARPQCAAVL